MSLTLFEPASLRKKMLPPKKTNKTKEKSAAQSASWPNWRQRKWIKMEEKGKTFLQRIKSFSQKMSWTWGSLTLFHKKIQISILVKISLGQNPFECTNLILNHHTAGVTSLGNALIWNVMYLRDILFIFLLLLYNLWVNSLDFAF